MIVPKGSITIKTPEEIAILRQAGKILSTIIKELKCSLKIGVTTKEIDKKAEELMRSYNVIPAFKGYHGFPGCICISVNEQVVHGVPGDRVIEYGDIVSLDVGLIYQNFYSDTAITQAIGEIKPEYRRLLDVTLESLNKGIEHAQVGNHVSDISHAIQDFNERHGFSIVREFVGHGIGRDLHEAPEIPNFGSPHQGSILKEGMVLAIEPMVNYGRSQTKILGDGWTVVAVDGKPSAHFEHCVVVQRDGPEILTK